ncbi:MAG: fructose-6-phosphate aldolase [Oscillospiraceae bacterium]|nr:fructose-6-phosphate aldolase [Oscillospiraceae bacterium]
MKILLDTARIEVIDEMMTYFPIAGFTTNPSILAKESSHVGTTLTELRRLAAGGKMVHIQVTADTAGGMLEQAKQLNDFFGGDFYAKIPMNIQGLKAISLCKAEGINCTVTAIFTPMQALTASMAGADFVAPYVDRLDNITSDGVNVVKEIVNLFNRHEVKTQVLAASFKNMQQVYDVASTGTHAVTVSGELCKKFLFHPYTDKSLEDFKSDWAEKFGNHEITDLLSL